MWHSDVLKGKKTEEILVTWVTDVCQEIKLKITKKNHIKLVVLRNPLGFPVERVIDGLYFLYLNDEHTLKNTTPLLQIDQ